MKRNFILISTAACIFAASSSFTLWSTMDKHKRNERVRLERTSRGTRSATATEINAYLIDGERLQVQVTCYTGNVNVEVSGTGGTLQRTSVISGEGFVNLDVSNLLPGEYRLTVYIGNTLYSGFFTY